MATRLEVKKTYKLYIGGQFPRSESGRTYPVVGRDGVVLAQAVRGSRKDLRDAVKAARGAADGWAARTAYNRGQILYRVAEVMEGRTAQFVDELRATGASPAAARREVEAAIDRWVWYAGWTDKIAQIVGGANPVSGPYFNFSVPEPMGVVGIVAPDRPALGGLVSRLAPCLAAGSVAVVLASETAPLAAITLAEALATSDVPGGVVNILSGHQRELVPWLAGHMDVDGIDVTGVAADTLMATEQAAADNVKRVIRGHVDEQHPDVVAAYMEIKTVWHPMGT